MVLPRCSGEVFRRDFRDGFDAKIVTGRRGSLAPDSFACPSIPAHPSRSTAIRTERSPPKAICAITRLAAPYRAPQPFGGFGDKMKNAKTNPLYPQNCYVFLKAGGAPPRSAIGSHPPVTLVAAKPSREARLSPFPAKESERRDGAGSAKTNPPRASGAVALSVLAKDLAGTLFECRKCKNEPTLSARLLGFYGGRYHSTTGREARPALIRLACRSPSPKSDQRASHLLPQKRVRRDGSIKCKNKPK